MLERLLLLFCDWRLAIGDAAAAAATLGLSFNFTEGGNSGSGSFTSQLNASAQGGYTTTYEYDPVYGGYRYVNTAYPSSNVKSDALSVAFTNNTGLAQKALLTMSASVNGNGTSGTGVGEVPISTTLSAGSLPPAMTMLETTADYVTYGVSTSVPEPQTWLTMLAGFAGIALAVRRHRSAV